jgi:broad specificity phosphatase PhoE
VTVRVRLVRHGRSAGTWGDDPDPGLDEVGIAEAEAIAATLAPTGPQPILVSPLRRARETADPLAAAWQVEPRVDAAVGELPAPLETSAEARTWLRALMAGTGAQHAAVMTPFRARVLGTIRALRADTVVVSHYLAINAVVGAALGDDRVVCCAPAHCSVTTVEIDGDALRVVALPDDTGTDVRL